jgi:hypothetical protein
MMIKPCPFCGCEPFRHHPGDNWEECSFCGARGPDMSRDAGQAIFHQDDELPWNIRSPLTVAEALEIPEVRALVSWMRRHEDCRCQTCIDPLLVPFPPTPDDDEVES